VLFFSDIHSVMLINHTSFWRSQTRIVLKQALLIVQLIARGLIFIDTSELYKIKDVLWYDEKALRGSGSVVIAVQDPCAKRQWVVSFRPRPFYPWERDLVPILQDEMWTSGPSGWVWKIPPPLRLEARAVQAVASRYNNCNIPAAHYVL